ERRPHPGALERGVAGLTEQLRDAEVLLVLLLVERQRRPCLPLLVLQSHHIVVEARNFDAAAAILHLRDHLAENESWIGDGTAERAGVEIRAAAAQIDLEVHQAAQAVAD